MHTLQAYIRLSSSIISRRKPYTLLHYIKDLLPSTSLFLRDYTTIRTSIRWLRTGGEWHRFGYNGIITRRGVESRTIRDLGEDTLDERDVGWRVIIGPVLITKPVYWGVQTGSNCDYGSIVSHLTRHTRSVMDATKHWLVALQRLSSGEDKKQQTQLLLDTLLYLWIYILLDLLFRRSRLIWILWMAYGAYHSDGILRRNNGEAIFGGSLDLDR